MRFIRRRCSRDAWNIFKWMFLTLLMLLGMVAYVRNGLREPYNDLDHHVAPDSDFVGFPGARIAGLFYEKPVAARDDDVWNFAQSSKKDWHNYAFIEQEAKRQGPGEQGKPHVVARDTEKQKKEADDVYRVNGYDGLTSDAIAFNRSVKDIRHPLCKTRKYLSRLPSVSVVVPFHDEHFSALMRTVYSTIIRSPRELLLEVVLVDDNSTKPFLFKPLDDYVAKHLADMVKVVRTTKREGLMRARQIGAKHARGQVIVFLDSHSEPTVNWLPPLIEPIAIDYRTAVCPLVDIVDCDTFEYRAQDEGARGSFDWEFNYKRLPLQPNDTKHPADPFPNPVMAGGYFAISRKWFWEFGGYDEGLDIWGGEQYEISFKIWQCHGRLVDAPCSRVGHIYRCKYIPFPNPGVGDFVSRNYKRVAEVWMDEYAKYLYERKPELLQTTDAGDIGKQLEVRKRLKCKSFKWFMEEVAFDQEKFYPKVEPPEGATGELRNVAADKCVDTRYRGKGERFGLEKCIKDGHSGGEQIMRLTWKNDIRPRKSGMCFDVSTSDFHAPVVLFPCHGMQGNQMWKYDPSKKQLLHPVSNLCLDCDSGRGELFMSACDSNVKTQQWTFDFVNQTVLDSWSYIF